MNEAFEVIVIFSRLKSFFIFFNKNEDRLQVFEQGSLSDKRSIVRQSEINIEDRMK